MTFPESTTSLPPSAISQRPNVGYAHRNLIRRFVWQFGMCVALALLVTPLSARAQTLSVGSAGDAPLRIERCVVTSRSELLDPLNSLRIDFVSGVNVRFVNLRQATATAVRFSFRYQGDTVSLTEHGMFASGLRIERSYATFAGQVSGGSSTSCTALQVTYDDGTTWFAHPM